MPQTTYTYSLSNDFPGGQINVDKLTIAIEEFIAQTLLGINVNEDVVEIIFADELTPAQRTVLDGNATAPAAGLIASTDTTAFIDTQEGRYKLLGYLVGANMNTTADQAIYIASRRFAVRRIVAVRPNGPMNLAVGGIYNRRNKQGVAVVPANQQWTGLGSPNNQKDLNLANVVQTQVSVDRLFFLSLTTPAGAAATCNILVWGEEHDIAGL